MKSFFICQFLILSAGVALCQPQSIPAPFYNLPSPIDSVTSYSAYKKGASKKVSCITMSPNLSICFYSNASRNVRSVVSGVVVSVVPISDWWLVIIKHEGFYFSYSNLKTAFVSNGDKADANTVLGTMAIDDDKLRFSVAIQVDTKEQEWNAWPMFKIATNDCTETETRFANLW